MQAWIVPPRGVLQIASLRDIKGIVISAFKLVHASLPTTLPTGHHRVWHSFTLGPPAQISTVMY